MIQTPSSKLETCSKKIELGYKQVNSVAFLGIGVQSISIKERSNVPDVIRPGDRLFLLPMDIKVVDAEFYMSCILYR